MAIMTLQGVRAGEKCSPASFAQFIIHFATPHRFEGRGRGFTIVATANSLTDFLQPPCDSVSDVSIVRLSFGETTARPKSLDVRLGFVTRSYGLVAAYGRTRYGTVTKQNYDYTRGALPPRRNCLGSRARTDRRVSRSTNVES